MRTKMMLLGCVALAACKGGGPETISAAPPPSSSSPGTRHSFATPTEPKTYNAIGGSQVFSYTTDNRRCCNQQGETFAATTGTVRDPKVKVAYDPRDAIFTLTVTDPNTGAATQTRFQDPASRTDFNQDGGPAGREPQWGTPKLAAPNVRYLQAGDGNPLSPYSSSGTGVVNSGNNKTPADGSPGSSYQSTTFFYGVPGQRNAAGTTTKFVTYAGYLRNAQSWSEINVEGGKVKQDSWHLERGAFAFGENTGNDAVPKSGTASYQGGMLATMVVNPTLDKAYGAELPTYFQWVEGTSRVDVDFGKSTVNVSMNGTVAAPQIDRYTAPQTSTIAAGTSFTASGSASIDMVRTGGFTGSMTKASFGATTNGAPTAVEIAGSSVDGTFFGPSAEEVGGSFHIVGGNPDERVDILGSFAGAKP
jgi:hypothetical protein